MFQKPAVSRGIHFSPFHCPITLSQVDWLECRISNHYCFTYDEFCSKNNRFANLMDHIQIMLGVAFQLNLYMIASNTDHLQHRSPPVQITCNTDHLNHRSSAAQITCSTDHLQHRSLATQLTYTIDHIQHRSPTAQITYLHSSDSKNSKNTLYSE